MISLKDRTTRIGINLSIYLGIILILHFFLGRPIAKMADREKEHLEEIEEDLKKKEALIREYPAPDKRMSELRKRIEELREKAGSGKELPRVIQQLIKKSSDLDIQIISIRPLEEGEFEKGEEGIIAEGVGRSYIEVILRSPYRTLGEYLKALEKLSETREIFFTIENVTIEKIQNEEMGKKSNKEKNKEEKKLIVRLIVCSYTVWTI